MITPDKIDEASKIVEQLCKDMERAINEYRREEIELIGKLGACRAKMEFGKKELMDFKNGIL